MSGRLTPARDPGRTVSRPPTKSKWYGTDAGRCLQRGYTAPPQPISRRGSTLFALQIAKPRTRFADSHAPFWQCTVGATEHAWVAQLAWTDDIERSPGICIVQRVQCPKRQLLADQLAGWPVIEPVTTSTAFRRFLQLGDSRRMSARWTVAPSPSRTPAWSQPVNQQSASRQDTDSAGPAGLPSTVMAVGLTKVANATVGRLTVNTESKRAGCVW